PTFITIREQLQRFLRRGHRLLLLLCLLIQNAQGGKVVLHLLKGGQCGLAIGGDGGVVVGDGRVGSGAAASRIKEYLRRGRADGPEEARPHQHVPYGSAFEAGGSTQGYGGEKGRLGDADLLIRLGDPALRGRDVRATLQQLGRQADGDSGRLAVQWRRGQPKSGRRLSN